MSSLAATSSTDFRTLVGDGDKTSITTPDDTRPYMGNNNETLVVIKDASELLAPSATSKLESYINKNLVVYSVGLILSVAALVYSIIIGLLGAIVVTSIIVLGFLDMVVTVAIDKKTSIKK